MIDSLFRKLPSFKGKRRLANLFVKRDISHYRDIIIKGKFGCRYKLPNIKENIGFEIFVNGVYEKEIIELIAGQIPANGNMIDIGANIGTIVLPVCKLRKDIHATAIEASPRVFDYLRTNGELNQITNCTMINKAITNIDAAEIPFYSPVEQFGIGSVDPGFTYEAEMTATQTLDSLVKEYGIIKTDLIKIDIEGHEYFAFKSGQTLLSDEDAPMILFEFAEWAEELAKGIIPGDAQRLLIGYGYDLYLIDAKGKLSPLASPLTKGNAMILASKQKK